MLWEGEVTAARQAVVLVHFIGSPVGRHVLAVLALCLLTVFALQVPWRFTADDPILALGTTADIPSRWIVSEDGLSARATSGAEPFVLDAAASAAVPYITVVKRDLASHGFLRIAAEFAVEALRPGENPWQRAEVIVVSFDRSARPIRFWPMKVMSVDRDRHLQRSTATFPVHPETSAFRLLVYNGATEGTMSVRSVTVSPLTERAVFSLFRWVVVGLWIAYLGYLTLVIAYLAGNRWAKALLLGLAMATAVAVLTPQPYYGYLVDHVERLADLVRYGAPTVHPVTATPDQTEPPETPSDRKDPGTGVSATPPQVSGQEMNRNAESDRVADPDAPRSFPPPSSAMEAGTIDRILDYLTVKQVGHFSMFLLLSVTALIAYPKQSPAMVVSVLVISAGATEVLQLFLATRSSSLADFALNLGGLIFGTLIVAAARRVVRRSVPAG